MELFWKENVVNKLDGLLQKKVQDEYFTPDEMVNRIIPFLKPRSTILCPFSKADSRFVVRFIEEGFTVKYGHIETGQDFFLWSKKDLYDVDYIIDNPPFSQKFEVVKRLYELGKNFAMVFNIGGLFTGKIVNFLDENSLKFNLVIPSKRTSFIDGTKPNDKGQNPPFLSVYFCNFLNHNEAVK